MDKFKEPSIVISGGVGLALLGVTYHFYTRDKAMTEQLETLQRMVANLQVELQNIKKEETLQNRKLEALGKAEKKNSDSLSFLERSIEKHAESESSEASEEEVAVRAKNAPRKSILKKPSVRTVRMKREEEDEEVDFSGLARS